MTTGASGPSAPAGKTAATAGIAVTILIGQLKDFFGLTFTHAPVETVEKASL